ncbi:MAG: biotin synthase BioB [Candidatus Omnitrophica bacterium]|nr:biotin synthase BioB [Candidatus Omnitrophota bacterium]
MIKDILDGVLSGRELDFDDAGILLSAKRDDLYPLMHAADTIRRRFCGNKMDMCSLVNAKSGLCTEDCKFCAQASRHKTGCETYPLISVEKMVKAASEAKKIGASNFCIVISGEGPTKEEFKKIKQAIEKINKEVGIKVDCSLGALEKEMIHDLKSLGIDRYNHNLETSETYYKNICTTHSHKNRSDMVGILKDAGLRPCCGGIIGMGEALEDRISLAFLLKKINVNCVPINIFNPIKGTPLEKIEQINPLDAIKTIAVFRLILQKPTIKIAGGREAALRDLQAMAFCAGANGMIIGGYLTTKGRSVKEDLQMAKDLGFEV